MSEKDYLPAFILISREIMRGSEGRWKRVFLQWIQPYRKHCLQEGDMMSHLHSSWVILKIWHLGQESEGTGLEVW